MLRGCKNLLVRKRKKMPYFYCKELKEEITPSKCKNCLKRNLVSNRPIKSKSNKRITVSKETYQKVIERDNYMCRLRDCTCEGGLELHHIVYRSENKSLIDEPNNCIMLCNQHHRLVHSNKHMWQPVLKEIINNL